MNHTTSEPNASDLYYPQPLLSNKPSTPKPPHLPYSSHTERAITADHHHQPPSNTQPLMTKKPQPESLFSVYETNPIFVTLSLCGGWGVRIAPLRLRLRRSLLRLSPLEQPW